MELEKLEKLSCLKIEESYKLRLVKSIEGVMDMLHEVDTLVVKKPEDINFSPTVFRTSEIAQDFDKNSLPIEEGLFLAPKVIKKD